MNSNAFLLTQNPQSGAELHRYPVHSPQEIDVRLQKARRGFIDWRRSPMAHRKELLDQVEKILLREQEVFARLIELEMGKLFSEAMAEVEKCAKCAAYYRDYGPEFLAPLPIPTEARLSYAAFEPLGTVLAIMPWNFPFWQAFRCALPSLLAGNTVLLKHASNVTGCALAIERIFQEAANRSDLFQALLVPGKSVLPLIARSEISAVSLTGSTEVGKEVAAAAGAVLKKCVLELGGSDPYIVLKDANLAQAASICAQSRLLNAGQSCISAKRFIVEKSVHAEFQELFLQALQSAPAAPLAPLARADLRETLHKQVVRSVEQGARLLCGGKLPESLGFHYPTTLLSTVGPGMPAYEEELFGPVAALIEARDAEHAIEIANNSCFGLGAAVFTNDLRLGEEIAQSRLEAGACFVNTLVRSDPRLPFGGIKESGYGRELSSFGVREFTNVKTVLIENGNR